MQLKSSEIIQGATKESGAEYVNTIQDDLLAREIFGDLA